MSGAYFTEEQWFPRFIGVLVGGISVATFAAALAARTAAAEAARSLLFSVGLVLALMGLFAPMRTTVTNEGITVTFGIPGWIRFHIAAADIRRVEPVTYRPLVEFGGWGIRIGKNNTRAYTARGNRGVYVYTDQRPYLIGSERPEELARALALLQR